MKPSVSIEGLSQRRGGAAPRHRLRRHVHLPRACNDEVRGTLSLRATGQAQRDGALDIRGARRPTYLYIVARVWPTRRSRCRPGTGCAEGRGRGRRRDVQRLAAYRALTDQLAAEKYSRDLRETIANYVHGTATS
jgi:hypothetical protein